MAGEAKEVFLANHRLLEDETLLALPAQGPLTPLELFVCTYVAKLGNLHMNFVELTKQLCVKPHGCLLAINGNFGHASQPGYEHLLKTPKPPPERPAPSRGRVRKFQGDGTCFNSAVEPIIGIDHPDIPEDKVYKTKCFPTTGEAQVPGVVCPDLSDGHAVLVAFVAYLNELSVGDFEDPAVSAEAAAEAAGPAGLDIRRKPVVIEKEQPKMLNYKFRVVRNSPRILVNLNNLARYLHDLEYTKASVDNPLPELQKARFAGWPSIVLPPFPVRETKPPTDDVKVSFRFQGADRWPRVNVFQERKINVLGAATPESARLIYDWFVRLFTENWSMLVCLQPRRDSEKRQAAAAAEAARAAERAAAHAAANPAPAPVRLTDAELEELLAEVSDDEAVPRSVSAKVQAPMPLAWQRYESAVIRFEDAINTQGWKTTYLLESLAQAKAGCGAASARLGVPEGDPLPEYLAALRARHEAADKKATLCFESLVEDLVADADEWDTWGEGEDEETARSLEDAAVDEVKEQDVADD
jgi:hypothetical protein